MHVFLIRFLLFGFLWTMMIYHASTQPIFSLFMLTVSLAFFFFLSNQNISVYIYILLSVKLFIHGIIIEEIFYTSLLLLIVTVIALFRLSKNALYILIGINFQFVIALTVYLGKPL